MQLNMDVSKNRGTPKMDGENNETPYEQMDDLGGKTPYFWVDTHMENAWVTLVIPSYHWKKNLQLIFLSAKQPPNTPRSFVFFSFFFRSPLRTQKIGEKVWRFSRVPKTRLVVNVQMFKWRRS